MLPHSIEKVKTWIADNRTDLFAALVVFLIGIASFGLGRLSVVLPQKEQIYLEDNSTATDSALTSSSGSPGPASPDASPGARLPEAKNGSFVASKSGSVYYAVWCSGASKIREENKVWFQTKEEAKTQGYRPAKNCSGL